MEENDDFGHRKPAKLPKFPYGTTYKNTSPDLFEEEKKLVTPSLDPCGRIRLFEHLRDTSTVGLSIFKLCFFFLLEETSLT